MSEPTAVTVSLRLPPDLHDRLSESAKERGLSINRLAIEALRDFLPRLIPADEWKLTR